MATKLSQNPHYGVPRNHKVKQRLDAWKIWAAGMLIQREIAAEIAPVLAQRRAAESRYEWRNDD